MVILLYVTLFTLFVTPACPCDSSDECNNGGTCPEDDGCSGCDDEPVCDCLAGFTGETCDVTGPQCMVRNEDVNVVNEPPTCRNETLEVPFDLSKRDEPVLCFDKYDTDLSTCYDNDSCITFSILEQEADSIFVVQDYPNRQCVMLNTTVSFNHTNLKFTLLAEEIDGSEQNASLTLKVIFIRPHTVFYINRIVENGIVTRNLGLGSTNLTYSLKDSSLHQIHPTTGVLTLNINTIGLIKLTVEAQSIHDFKTEFNVHVTILDFDCNNTQRIVYVDVDDVPSPVGKVDCLVSSFYNWKIDYLNTTDLKLVTTGNDNSVLQVVNASAGYHTLDVVAYLYLPEPKQRQEMITFTINIIVGEIQTSSFRLTNETWNPSYTNSSSTDYISLEEKVENNTYSELSNVSSIYMDVLVFSEGSVMVDYRLVAFDQTNLTLANETMAQAVRNGFVGVLPVGNNSYSSRDGDTTTANLTYSNSDHESSPGSTLNDTHVTFSCRAVFSPVGGVVFEWRMTEGDALIIPVNNSRFQMTRVSTFSSSLSVNTIQTKDSGPFTCIVKDEGNSMAKANITVKVISPPVVNLTPLKQVFINTTDSITLTCNVTEPRTEITNVTWFINGRQVKTENNITSMLQRTATSFLPNSTFVCRAANRAGEGVNSTTTTVYILPALEKTCDDEGEWKTTPAGETVEMLCPDGETGIRYRACSEEGMWQNVDRGDCVSNDITDIKEDAEFISEGVQVKPLSTMTDILANSTAPESLGNSELEIVVDVLQTVVESAIVTNVSRDQNETRKILQGFVTTVSNTLDEEVVSDWADTDESQVNATSPVDALILVENLTQIVTQSLDEGETVHVFDAPNLVVLVGKTAVNETTVVFPDPSVKDAANITASVKLKAETLNSLSGEENTRYSFIYYKNITRLLPDPESTQQRNIPGEDNITRLVNSGIWGVNIYPEPGVLEPPLILNFTHLNNSVYDNNPVCVYLDLNTDEWESKGCSLRESTRTYTVCECRHLTNFAILMNPFESTSVIHALSIITLVGCSISVVCLAITVIVYVTLWRFVKNNQSILLMNLCVSLGVAMLLFIIGVERKDKSVAGCQVVAVFLHLFFLVAFSMMLAAGLETLWTVLTFAATGSKIKPLLVGAWILPVIIVVVSMGATQMEGYGNDDYCWLSTESNLIWAFIGPVVAILLVNFVVTGKLMHAMNKTRYMQEQDTIMKVKKTVRGICVMVPILGMSWIFGVFAVNDDSVVFQYIFAIINSLQGLFIFIFHCVLKRRIRIGLNHYRRILWSSQFSSLKRSNQPHENKRRRNGGQSENDLVRSTTNPSDESPRPLYRRMDTRQSYFEDTPSPLLPRVSTLGDVAQGATGAVPGPLTRNFPTPARFGQTSILDEPLDVIESSSHMLTPQQIHGERHHTSRSYTHEPPRRSRALGPKFISNGRRSLEPFRREEHTRQHQWSKQMLSTHDNSPQVTLPIEGSIPEQPPPRLLTTEQKRRLSSRQGTIQSQLPPHANEDVTIRQRIASQAGQRDAYVMPPENIQPLAQRHGEYDEEVVYNHEHLLRSGSGVYDNANIAQPPLITFEPSTPPGGVSPRMKGDNSNTYNRRAVGGRLTDPDAGGIKPEDVRVGLGRDITGQDNAVDVRNLRRDFTRHWLNTPVGEGLPIFTGMNMSTAPESFTHQERDPVRQMRSPSRHHTPYSSYTRGRRRHTPRLQHDGRSETPHIDFVPSAVRRNTSHITGTMAPQPFLHPHMMGASQYDHLSAPYIWGTSRSHDQSQGRGSNV